MHSAYTNALHVFCDNSSFKIEKIGVLRFLLHVLALIGCLKAVGLKINRNNRAATGICSIRNNLGKLGHRLWRCGKIILNKKWGENITIKENRLKDEK